MHVLLINNHFDDGSQSTTFITANTCISYKNGQFSKETFLPQSVKIVKKNIGLSYVSKIAIQNAS